MSLLPEVPCFAHTRCHDDGSRLRTNPDGKVAEQGNHDCTLRRAETNEYNAKKGAANFATPLARYVRSSR